MKKHEIAKITMPHINCVTENILQQIINSHSNLVIFMFLDSLQ